MGLYTPEGMIKISVTSTCNLDCLYCYTNKENNEHQTIDINFAKAGIRDFFNTSTSRRIRFYGAGEPSTKFKLLQAIAQYTENISETPVEFEIQTNGVFSEEINEWLARKMSVIYISSDGQPEIQDYYRPFPKGQKSSDILERNIRFLVNSSKAKISIRAGIGRSNVDRQKEIIRYFADLGIRNIWTRPLFIPPIAQKKIQHEIIGLEEYTKKFLEARQYAETLKIFYGSFLSCNFDISTKYYCGASRPSPVLTTDGFVSSCEHVLFGETANEYSLFLYGRWIPQQKKIEYDQSAIQRLQRRSVENISGCSDCQIQKKCGGYCMAEVMKAADTIYGKKPGICTAIQRLARELPPQTQPYECSYP